MSTYEFKKTWRFLESNALEYWRREYHENIWFEEEDSWDQRDLFLIVKVYLVEKEYKKREENNHVRDQEWIKSIL